MALNNAPLNVRLAILGAGVEDTPGEKATVTTALANTVIYDAQMEPDGLYEDGQRMPQGNFAGTSERVKGLIKGRLRFRQELRHNDGLYTLLRGSGYVLSGTGDTNAHPASNLASRDTLTMVLWENGRRKTIFGAQAQSLRIAPEGGAGRRVFAEWEFMGIWDEDVVDNAMPSDATVTTAAFTAKGMTVQVDEDDIPPISQWEINLNPETALREDVVSSTGLSMYLVEDRNPIINLDPEALKVADYDHFEPLKDADIEALELVLSDGTNTLEIHAPQTQRINVTDESRAKKRVDQIELECHNDNGDDDLFFVKGTAA